MARFYINQSIEIGREISLPNTVTQHLNVTRKKDGDTISVFNGNGLSYTAKILSIQRKSCLVVIKGPEPESITSDINLHLGLSIIANDKMDLAIRSATELGVKTITPLISNYSQTISKDRLENRIEHWQKVIISASEQCGQNTIPSISIPMHLKDFVQQPSSNKFILSLHNNKTAQSADLKKSGETSLLIGPEGGFTDEEVDLATLNGYIAIKPWHNILRAETAVCAGISLIINNLT